MTLIKKNTDIKTSTNNKKRKRGKTPNGDISTVTRLSIALRYFSGGCPFDNYIDSNIYREIAIINIKHYFWAIPFPYRLYIIICIFKIQYLHQIATLLPTCSHFHSWRHHHPYYRNRLIFAVTRHVLRNYRTMYSPYYKL